MSTQCKIVLRLTFFLVSLQDTMLEMGFQKAVESIIKNVKNPGAAARCSKYFYACKMRE